MRTAPKKPSVSLGRDGRTAVVRIPIVGKTPTGKSRARIVLGISEDGVPFCVAVRGWTPLVESLARRVLAAIEAELLGATRPATAADRAAFRRINRDNLEIWRMQKRLGLGRVYPKPQHMTCPKVFRIQREYRFDK